MQKDRKILLERLSEEVDEIALEWRKKIEALSNQFNEASTKLSSKIRELKNVSSDQKIQLEKEIKSLKLSLNTKWNEWIELTNLTTKEFELVHAH